MAQQQPAANVFARKPTSTKVTQQPGGNQSVNIFTAFNEAPPAEPQPQPPRVAQTPTYGYAADSPFNPAAPAQQTEQRSSIAVRRGSATYTPHVDSPFSREPPRQTGRQSSAVNNYSAESPFNSSAPPQAAAAAPQMQRSPSKVNVPSEQSPFSAAPVEPEPPKAREFKAIAQSAASPFSGQEYQAPVTPQRPFRANEQTPYSPFSAQADAAPPAVKSTIGVRQAPGGTANINLFQEPQVVRQEAKVTPTYGYAAESPFNPQGQAPPPIARRESKANLESSRSPFSDAPAPAESSPARAPPKANLPAANSPFNPNPDPPRNTLGNAANRESGTSPFASAHPPAGPTEVPPPRSTVRIAQQPGGNASFNLFSGQ